MYPAICSYDDETFDDMSEESEEKKTLTLKKSLRPVPSQGMVEQVKKHGGFQTPARFTRIHLQTP